MNRRIVPNFKRLGQEGGAIDLASIMVGVAVMAILAGVIGATVFMVIPWAQDNAARSQLSSVVQAQTTQAAMMDGNYATDISDYLNVKDADVRVVSNESTCFGAFKTSASGKSFYVSSQTTTPTTLNPGVWPSSAPANYPAECVWPASAKATTGNIAANPNGLAGVGWSPNNTVYHRMNPVSGLTGHPNGITTARQSQVLAETTSALSSYNIDGLGLTTTPRYVGVWLYTDKPGYNASVGIRNGQFGVTPLTPNTWTYIETPEPISGYAAAFIVTDNKRSAEVDGKYYATGAVAYTK